MTTAIAPINGNGGLTRQPPQQGTTLKEMLEKRRDIIADVLPKHLTPERLIKLATVAVARVPLLGQCTGLSVVNSVIKAAELGLDCSGTLGSAYLVPYANNKKDVQGRWSKVYEAQLIIGYRGMIDLARRSGQILSIEARVVWKNDEFCYEMGLEPKLIHKPTLDKEPGDFRLVYAIAKLRDGATQFEVMTKAEIDAIRRRSRAGESGPWVSDYPEMARKTVVKRLAKYLPLSVELATAIEEDNRTEFPDLIDGELVNTPAQKLNKLLDDSPTSQQLPPPSPRADAPIDPSTADEEPPPVPESELVRDAAGESDDQSATAPTADEPQAPPPDDLSDWQTFYELAGQAAADAGKSPSEFEKGINSALMLIQKKGKHLLTTVDWRTRILAAIRAGTFEFKTGKIAKEQNTER